MNVAFARKCHRFIAGASLFATASCARKPGPSLNPMHAAPICDKTPMKRLGRAVEIPEIHRRIDFGTVIGTVVQDETGDALEGAVVDLTLIDHAPDTAPIARFTNSKGGFGFDSLTPATYRLLVKRIGEWPRLDTIQATAGRVDTVSLRMRANRCFGY
jgi:hypothetical protein